MLPYKIIKFYAHTDLFGGILKQNLIGQLVSTNLSKIALLFTLVINL